MKEYGNNQSCQEIVENPASKSFKVINEWIESVIQAVIVVVITLAFIFRIVNVSGWSMLNTLRDGDKLIVLKWYYAPRNKDVVVISKGQHLNEPLIKRVIATQGQTLSIDFSDGSVTVDGIKLNETYIREPMSLEGDGDIPNVVPKGYSFVMGDNRNHSWDSRFKEVGLIDNNDIVGRATFILYPLDRFGVIK